MKVSQNEKLSQNFKLSGPDERDTTHSQNGQSRVRITKQQKQGYLENMPACLLLCPPMEAVSRDTHGKTSQFRG